MTKSHFRLPPKGSYPAFWLDAHRGLSNPQREALNEWREEQRLRLEALRLHANALAALLEGGPLHAQATDIAKRAKGVEEAFTNTTPLTVRVNGQNTT
jgi:hypothetical protein